MNLIEYVFEFTNSNNICKNYLNELNSASFTNAKFINNNVICAGNNSYIEISNLSILEIFTNKLQIEFIANIKYGTKTFIIHKNNLFNIAIEDNTIFLSYFGNNGTYTLEYTITNVPYNKYSHYLITIDLSLNEIFLYIDNTSISSVNTTGSASTAFVNSTDNIYIGSKTGLLNSDIVSAKVDFIALNDAIFDTITRSARAVIIEKYISTKYGSPYGY